MRTPASAIKIRPKAVLSAATIACCTALLLHWEGMDLVVKHNSFDPAGVYTVCAGVTNLDPEFKDIKPGQRFTKQECEDALAQLIPAYAYPLDKCLKNFKEYGPHRQASLISFAYNLGPGTVCNGKVGEYLNAGRIADACEYMTHYTKSAGRYLPGLFNRRTNDFWGEKTWCLRGD